MPCAPWLPPMTSTMGSDGFRPNFSAATARSIRSRPRRTGVPVTTQLRPPQVIRAALEPEQGLVHHRRDETRDPARNGVGLVNERRQPQPAAEQQGNRAGEPAHADDRRRLKVAVDLAALAPAADQAHPERGKGAA